MEKSADILQLSVAKAIDVYQAFNIAVPDSLKNSEQSAVEFIKELLQNELYIDAINFLAYGLPKREAIAWANQCVRQTLRDTEQTKFTDNLISQWLDNPTEELRFKLETQADNLPLTWLRLAIFWSKEKISLIKKM